MHRITSFVRRRRNPILAVFALSLVFVLYTTSTSHSSNSSSSSSSRHVGSVSSSYDSATVATNTISNYDHSTSTYKLVIVADMDKASKVPGTSLWKSRLKYITVERNDGLYHVNFGNEFDLLSSLNEAGRGMELSELINYNSKLLSVDDRSGVVFEIDREREVVIPMYILMTGDGHNSKGFKAEWMAVKDELLYIGSIGKEWTSSEGTTENIDPQWVKLVDRQGRIKHVNWADRYNALRVATGTSFPGYLLHEAVCWNAYHSRWFFLPRRASTEDYDEEKDEERATNLLISVDESFNDFKTLKLGPLELRKGFSSFKFVPARPNEIIALKTEEFKGNIATYIVMYDIVSGRTLMNETFVGDIKYEGIEFL